MASGSSLKSKAIIKLRKLFVITTSVWTVPAIRTGSGVTPFPLARILAVADAYNAMTSRRPYREAMPPSLARMRLAQGVETQFDTAIVAAFEAILVGADDTYLVGLRAEFEFSVQQRPRLVAVAASA